MARVGAASILWRIECTLIISFELTIAFWRVLPTIRMLGLDSWLTVKFFSAEAGLHQRRS